MLATLNARQSCAALLATAGVWFAGGDAFARETLAIVTERSQETLVLSVKSASPRKVFTLPSPDRLVVDLPAVGSRPEATLPDDYHGKLVKRVRFGQFNPHTWRMVFDLQQPVRVLNEEHKGGQLNIRIAASDASGVRTESGREEGRERNLEDSERRWPGDIQKKIAEEDFRAGKQERETAKKSVKPQKREEKDNSKLLKPSVGKPLVAIDPGHGGVDPGAKGVGGTYEKEVVLDYARELRTRLLKTGKYNVMLTRDDDEIIPLRKRVDLARKAGAKIFISLHADSAPDEVRGLSVYTVSEKASDEETEALAARENKADVLTGMDLSDEREDVAGILISLAERETKNRSATLADMLVTALDDKVQLLPNSHRFAGFAVLKAPDIPSVLVEIGFLSHPKEEKLINSKTYREKVTSGIASGIDDYFRHEKRMGEL